MIELPSRRIAVWPLRVLCLSTLLGLGACFPNAEELQPNGASPGAGGGGGTTPANGGAGGSQTDGPSPTDGPVSPDAATPDAIVIPDVEGSTCADFAAVWCARAQQCQPRSLGYMVAGLDCGSRLT